jgi:hypothetical protein
LTKENPHSPKTNNFSSYVVIVDLGGRKLEDTLKRKFGEVDKVTTVVKIVIISRKFTYISYF